MVFIYLSYIIYYRNYEERLEKAETFNNNVKEQEISTFSM